jgi:MFS family permease
VPLFVTEVLHRPPLWTGVGFVVVAGVNALMLLPAGRYADSRGRRPVLVAGCATSCAGIVVLALVPDLGGYLVAMAVFGAGSGLLDVAPAAVVGDVASGRGGRVVAAYQMAGDLGVIAGPVVAGQLADVSSYRTAFLVTAAVLALAAVVGAAAPEHRR